MYLTVSAGTIAVRERQEVPVLAEIDGWVDRVRNGRNPPATVTTLLRRLDSAEFDLAERGGPRMLQVVLVRAAELEEAVGRATSFRSDARLRPVQGLRAQSWMPVLDDGTAEFRIAAATASQHDDTASLRLLVRPMVMERTRRRLEWSEAPPPVVGLGVRPIHHVLADALVRRSVEATAASQNKTPYEGLGGPGPDAEPIPGVQTAYRWRIPAPVDDVAAFAEAEVDESRLGGLLSGLMLLDWRASVEVGHWFQQRHGASRPPAPAWSLLAPFFYGRAVRSPTGNDIRLRPGADWPAKLRANRVESVLTAALLRLRIARLDPAVADTGALARGSPSGQRIAAALMVPLSSASVSGLLRRIVPPPLDS